MINLTSQTPNSGQHGSYYKLSPSLGVKVIHSPVFKSKAKAYRSKAHRFAKEEARILIAAFESGVVARCYGTTLVKVHGGYKVGVLMQHLGSTRLSNSEFYDFAEAYDMIQDKLEEVDLRHDDLNEDNIMVYRGKLYAVDFSPECISINDN